MSECVIFNKYIFIYIYICLLHFVANEEEKLLIRYNGGEKEWAFTLDLNIEGGLELYNRLKENKKIELTFEYNPFVLILQYNDTFPPLIKTSSIRTEAFEIGDIMTSLDYFAILVIKIGNPYYQKIGHLIQTERSSIDELNTLSKNSKSGLNLEFVFEADEVEKPDTTKIAEINKKIIIIVIIGLSILIILFIIKFIV